MHNHFTIILTSRTKTFSKVNIFFPKIKVRLHQNTLLHRLRMMEGKFEKSSFHTKIKIKKLIKQINIYRRNKQARQWKYS